VSCGAEHPACGLADLALLSPVLEAERLANAPLCCPSLSHSLIPEEISVPTVQNKILGIALSYVA